MPPPSRPPLGAERRRRRHDDDHRLPSRGSAPKGSRRRRRSRRSRRPTRQSRSRSTFCRRTRRPTCSSSSSASSPARARPDVLESDVTYPAKFALAGWIKSLTSLHPNMSQFFATEVAAGTYKGAPYAMPWFDNPEGLFYRTDLIKTPPTSPAQVVSDAAGGDEEGQDRSRRASRSRAPSTRARSPPS